MAEPQPLPAAVDATNTMPVLLEDVSLSSDASDDGDDDESSYVPSGDADDDDEPSGSDG
jgi:hypothetical protein